MAKGNLLLGKAKGKLGSVVFAQANGEQITRSKPESVKNPKSTGQNTQRAILATIAKSAAAMTALVDHSFAGVKYGADSVRYFRKINLGNIRNMFLNKPDFVNLIAKGGNFVPNPLKISSGSLPVFYAGVDTEDDTIAFYQSEEVLPRNEDVSVYDFLAAYPNLQGGDQLTLVKIKKVAGSLHDGNGIFTMSLDRMVFAPNAFDDKDATFIEGGSGVIGEQFLDLTKTTNANMLNVADGGAGGGLGFSDNNCYYAALILSRKVNNQWQRSTQYLVMMNYDDSADNAAAIASYGATASVNAQKEYLNQAEQTTGKKGVSGSYANFYSQIGDTENDLTSLHAGETKSINISAAANSEILLTCSGFGTADNPIVKTEIIKGNELLKMGQKYCEWLFKLTAETAGQYIGRVMFRDGSKAEITWNVSVQ